LRSNKELGMKNRIVILFVIIPAMLLLAALTPDVIAGEAGAGQKAFATSKGPAASPAALRYPALVDVGSKQCIPCKMMEPVLEELKVEYAGVLRVEFIDVQVDPETAVKLGVRGIPTQIFYDASGKERYRHMGYISKENILAAFKKLGVELVRKDGGKKGK
jgi:thioredoxin 1